MKTALRVVHELIGPPVIGVLLAIASGMIRGTFSGEPIHDIQTFYQAFLGGLFFAVFYVGIQSVCYTLLMEIAFKMGLKPGSKSSVFLSTVLGALAGASFIIYDHGNTKASEFLRMVAIGATVGLVISGIVGRFRPKHR